jgi:hypothetical protein
MAVLVPGRPLTQRKPIVLVENQLAVGRHRFQLVVTDDEGNASKPALIDIVVQRGRQPIGPFVRPDGIRPIEPSPINPRPLDPRPRPTPRPRPQ